MTVPIAAFLILFAASPALAQDERVGVRLREWRATMEGHLQSNGDTSGGSSVDLGEDLGLDDPGWCTEIQVYGRLPAFGRLYAGWWRIHREGDEFLTRTITFNDQTFTGTTEVKSEVTLDVGYLTYEYVFPTIPLGDVLHWELGLEIGARIMRGAGSIESSSGSGSDSGLIGTPVLGGHAAVQVTPFLRADVEVVGLAFSYSGNKGFYLEAWGELVVQPVPSIFAGVGYKYVALEVKSNVGSTDFDLDVHITGLFLTAGLRF